MSNNLLEAKNITREYHRAGNFLLKGASFKALKGVSFGVQAGKTLAIVGESGCGKSTLARILTMIDPHTSGSLIIDGESVDLKKRRPNAELRKKVQIVFQNPYGSLNPRQKIGEALIEPLLVNTNYSKHERQQRALDMLEKVGMDRDSFGRYPHMFSGGQRQRIAIARALMLHPKLLILDEPVSALDLSVQAQVLNLLMELQEELHLTYVFISHDLSVVRHISNDVLVMYYGEIVEQGNSESVFSNPQHDYSKTLLRACPRIDLQEMEQRLKARRQLMQALASEPELVFHSL